ncbi:enoyl-CoA hydratase/isomerase family protein [Nocardia sp. NPDC003345]
MKLDSQFSEAASDSRHVVQVERSEQVMIIRLNRPASRNALTGGAVETLLGQIRRAEEDPSVHGLILTGTGTAFCAGDDLYEAAGSSPEEFERTIANLQALTAALLGSRLVSMAAINGPAFGGGLELTLACDLRICSSRASFACPEVKWGLMATNASSILLSEVIGRGRALEMVLTGRVYDAAWARDAGLVSDVVEADSLLDHATDLVGSIVESAHSAMSTRVLFAAAVTESADAAIEREGDAVVAAFRTDFAQDRLLPFKTGRSRGALR